ncbi:MAG: formate dehydrogenase subunit gamma [Variovorax sp.]|nr:formate dehydrogenase subunit gamma [Variovorax sp.]
MTTRYLRRYGDATRMNHWFVVLMFLAAALSGLPLLHPSLYFFSNVAGGGSWARILHPYMGVLMVLGFTLMFFTMWRDNLLNADDGRWMANASRMLKGDKSNMPPIGKYNAGQKIVFWMFGLSLLLLFVSGFVFWRPWFVGFFPILLRRIAVVVHAASAVVLVLSVIVHVYAALWIKGTMRAMTRGTVTENWARFNHPLWHRKMTGGE